VSVSVSSVDMVMRMYVNWRCGVLTKTDVGTPQLAQKRSGIQQQ
jgi:hypothetical protein